MSKKLVEKGHRVTVEESKQRCVPISEYKNAGGQIVKEGTWPNAPKQAIILGLKDLPGIPELISHNHVFFGHCFKGQKDSEKLLSRFSRGGGKLFDLEYLVDEQKRRVAAFGVAAGMIGMALGIVMWTDIQHKRPHTPISRNFQNYKELTKFVSSTLSGLSTKPKVLVIGALGRVGSSACNFAKNVGVQVVGWDVEQTSGKSGPFPEILTYDIFVNTIYLGPNNPKFVFLNSEILEKSKNRNLSVISDISCDPNNKLNPLPIYSGTTDFETPAKRILDNPPLDVVAIDHLPSLVPEESSREFATALLPHLMEFGNSIVWKNALDVFEQQIVKISEKKIGDFLNVCK